MGLLPPVREGAQGRGRQVFQLVARMPQMTAPNVMCSCFVSSARYTRGMHESTETERPRNRAATRMVPPYSFLYPAYRTRSQEVIRLFTQKIVERRGSPWRAL